MGVILKKKILLLPHCELWSKLCGFGQRNTNIVKWVLDFQLLFEINTIFKGGGGGGKELGNGFGKIKRKKERKKEKGQKILFMYEFRCKNEKAGKKRMEKNNAKK